MRVVLLQIRIADNRTSGGANCQFTRRTQSLLNIDHLGFFFAKHRNSSQVPSINDKNFQQTLTRCSNLSSHSLDILLLLLIIWLHQRTYNFLANLLLFTSDLRSSHLLRRWAKLHQGRQLINMMLKYHDTSSALAGYNTLHSVHREVLICTRFNFWMYYVQAIGYDHPDVSLIWTSRP